MRLIALTLLMSTFLFGGYLTAQVTVDDNTIADQKHADLPQTSSTSKHKTMKGKTSAAANQLESAAAAELVEMRKQVSDVVQNLPAKSYRKQRLIEIDKWLEDGKEVVKARFLLKQLAADIAFRPKFEADQPKGFPKPTPVGEIELKSYPAYRMARTNSENNNAFFTLFQHIQSNNIAMTAPVEMSYSTSGDNVEEKTMAFLYGEPSTGEIQQSEKMEVVDAVPLKVISIGVRGKTSNESITSAVEQLKRRAKSQMPEMRLMEDIRVLGYNSPAVPTEQRYYEVQLQIAND